MCCIQRFFLQLFSSHRLVPTTQELLAKILKKLKSNLPSSCSHNRMTVLEFHYLLDSLIYITFNFSRKKKLKCNKASMERELRKKKKQNHCLIITHLLLLWGEGHRDKMQIVAYPCYYFCGSDWHVLDSSPISLEPCYLKSDHVALTWHQK